METKIEELIELLETKGLTSEALELSDLLFKVAGKKVIQKGGYKAIPGMKEYLKGGKKYKEGGAFDNSACMRDLKGKVNNPAAVCMAAEMALTKKVQKVKKGG
jgi:hypothetical protein